MTDLLATARRALPQRFWDKVDKTDECWNWKACRVSNGYGYYWHENKGALAHRVSYIAHKGPIPDRGAVKMDGTELSKEMLAAT